MPGKATMWDWFYVFAPFQIYLMIVGVLVVMGDHGVHGGNFVTLFFRRISNCLERWTGYPGWSMAGALSGLLMLGTAAIGLYWDIGWHIDFGRDNALMTPSHTMIVLGLGGLVWAALIAVIFASLDDAPVGLRIWGLRIPWSAITLAAFGIGGVAAFPFDAMWHDEYGIDITLWSPSHLQLLAGGGLATIVVWLMTREGRTSETQPTMLGRAIEATILGAILTGLSIFQGEFDFGVPQFQVLYLPILIAAAGAFTLVLGRLAMGPWGAVKTMFAFLIIRGVIAILVGGPFNETIPVFPLYIVAALTVEGAAFLVGTRDRLRFAAVAGAGVGLLGVLPDLAWMASLSEIPTSGAVLPKALLIAPIVAVAAAILGAGMARPVGGGTRIPAVAPVACGLVLIAALAYPLPRNVGHVEADIRVRPVGDSGLAMVEIDLQPADAAKNATGFGLVSWQGGGRESAALEEVAPGSYVSSKAVPVTGSWKAVIGLQRDDEVMAVPVYLPADPEIGEPEIPAVDRHETFVRNTDLLLRETKPGDPAVAQLAYTAVSTIVVIWIALFTWCAAKFRPEDDDWEDEDGGGWRPPMRTPQPASPMQAWQPNAPQTPQPAQPAQPRPTAGVGVSSADGLYTLHNRHNGNGQNARQGVGTWATTGEPPPD